MTLPFCLNWALTDDIKEYVGPHWWSPWLEAMPTKRQKDYSLKLTEQPTAQTFLESPKRKERQTDCYNSWRYLEYNVFWQNFCFVIILRIKPVFISGWMKYIPGRLLSVSSLQLLQIIKYCPAMFYVSQFFIGATMKSVLFN